MPESSITNPEPETPRRRRGGQKGNTNALKHGFYTSHFNTKELSSLKNLDSAGLKDEILMIRLFTRRLIEQSGPGLSFQDQYDALRILCLACYTITRMLKVQHLINKDGGSELDRSIDAALLQLAQEWNLH